MEAVGERGDDVLSKYNPTKNLTQFILGIYAYWRDKGMSIKSSKKRMYASTYQAIDHIGEEEDIQINYEEATKYMHHLVKRYGSIITKQDKADITEEQLETLKELKVIKDTLEPIVSKMKGQ